MNAKLNTRLEICLTELKVLKDELRKDERYAAARFVDASIGSLESCRTNITLLDYKQEWQSKHSD